jgi:hypothetical protein
MKHIVKAGRVSAVAVLVAGVGVLCTTPAHALCMPHGSSYSFTAVAPSALPTKMTSAYLTGPGTITFRPLGYEVVRASMGAPFSAAAARVVLDKASASMGVDLTPARAVLALRRSVSITVPRGQRRAVRLYQASRSFNVTKKNFNFLTCSWVPVYTNNRVDAPLLSRVDVWTLVA